MENRRMSPNKAPVSIPTAQVDSSSRTEIAQQLYKPLVDWEIRLLYLHPGTESEPLIASLYVGVLLQEGLGVRELSYQPVSYEALSYTWGEPVFTHTIELNGLDFTITENLSDALVHLRHENEGRLLWTDALCIDQSNLDEKSKQVRKMFRIYERATKVVIWLGQMMPQTEQAIKFIHNGHEIWQKDFARGDKVRFYAESSKHSSERKRWPEDTRRRIELVNEAVLDCRIRTDMAAVCISLKDIVQRPWLYRSWRLSVWRLRQSALLSHHYHWIKQKNSCHALLHIGCWCAKALNLNDKKPLKKRRKPSFDFCDDSHLFVDLFSTFGKPPELQNPKLLYPFDLYEPQPAVPQKRPNKAVIHSEPYDSANPPFQPYKDADPFAPSLDIHARTSSACTWRLERVKRSKGAHPYETSAYTANRGVFELHERLLSILSQSVHLLVTDDRDRLYATFEIVRSMTTRDKKGEEMAQLPTIDYRQTASEAFQRVATYIMNCRRDLSLLFDVKPLGMRPAAAQPHTANVQLDSSQVLLELPSWAPDWRTITVDDESVRWSSKRWVNQDLSPLVVQGRVYGKVTQIRATEEGSRYTLKERTKEGDVMLTRVFRDFLVQEQDALVQDQKVRFRLGQMRFPPAIDYDPDAPPWCRWFLPDATSTDEILVQAVGAPFPLVLRRLPEYGYHLVGFAEPWNHGYPLIGIVEPETTFNHIASHRYPADQLVKQLVIEDRNNVAVALTAIVNPSASEFDSEIDGLDTWGFEPKDIDGIDTWGFEPKDIDGLDTCGFETNRIHRPTKIQSRSYKDAKAKVENRDFHIY